MTLVPDSQHAAAGPTTVGDLLGGEARPARILGAFPTALYLRLARGEVIALLTRDAVLLPLGLRLPIRSADQSLLRWTGPAMVGAGKVQVGDRSVWMARVISVGAPTGLEPNADAIDYAAGRLAHLEPVEPALGLLEAVAGEQCESASVAAVDRLLGVGPGLTPSGDDVLAGFLVGAYSFGLVVDQLRRAVITAAPGATTDLSAALLRCAGRGESIPQVSSLLWALSQSAGSRRLLDTALVDLAHVGHSSGVALAAGVVAAAETALGVRGADDRGHCPRSAVTRPVLVRSGTVHGRSLLRDTHPRWTAVGASVGSR